MAEKKYDVFICYSRKDDPKAKDETLPDQDIDKILRCLDDNGVKYCIDREGKYVSQHYTRWITESLEASDSVLFLSSSNSNGSESYWPTKEIGQAAEMRMKIFPLLLDGTNFHKDISLIFSLVDRIEYYLDPEKGLEKLKNNLLPYVAKREIPKLEQKIENWKSTIKTLSNDINNRFDKYRSILSSIQEKQKEIQEWHKCLDETHSPTPKEMSCPICNTIMSSASRNCPSCGCPTIADAELSFLERMTSFKDMREHAQNLWRELQKERTDGEGLRQQLNEKGQAQVQNPVAFLLVTEYGHINVYSLFVGDNTFGSQKRKSEQSTYWQMVVSDNSLQPKHFSINVHREKKGFSYILSPIGGSSLSLNSEFNKVSTETEIQINDIILIGGLKIQLVDNFNK